MDRGHRSALKLLEGPAAPDGMGYLREWIGELHGRSGVGMGGLSPLSYTTIESWARLMGLTLQPRDVRALLALDAVLLYPDAE